MPLYKTITPNTKTTIKIWNITEAFDILLKPLSLKEATMQRVMNMKSDIHRRGFLSVRHLLRTFDYDDTDLYYDALGKPYLIDGKHISITHSFQYAAVIISDKKVGIDIEQQRPVIQHIATKFIDFESIFLCEQDVLYIQQLTKIWCIKESVYKLMATPGLSFKQHILTIPFSDSDNSTTVWVDYNNQKHKYQADFFNFDGFCCAYINL
jgi:4'-phosphopantetheinyl transferase